jgi:hypothetical protein
MVWGHGLLPELTGASATELSATDAWHSAATGDSESLRPLRSPVCTKVLTRIDGRANLAFRLVRLTEANGPPGLCTAARRRDRARPRRELGILLPLHGTVLIEMASAAPFVSSELTAPDVPEDQFRPNATFKPGLGG